MAASSSLQTSLRECSSGSSEIAFNSNVATSLLPWERSHDLKTGEVYYINWTSSGMKAKEDPSSSSSSSSRTTTNYSYSEDDESSYEESGGLSSLESSSSAVSSSRKENEASEQVLVVAGCKRCLMYFMVAKQVEECPKCNAQLLHFHRTDPIPS